MPALYRPIWSIAGFPYVSSTYCNTGGQMIWVLLLLVVLAGLFINSVRLTLLGILVLLIRMHPLATLSSIGAAIAWAIKQNLR
jgi:hypothetical protein